jgi:PHD/YefM family antitoxin component YafN of YafNO toxin-antitoxin module
MNAKRRLPFPLTPVNNGKQKIYCVYKEHWEMALEKSANDSMKQLKADMESLEFEG